MSSRVLLLRRETTNRVRRVLDDWLPPVVRDSRLLSSLVDRPGSARSWQPFISFRQRIPYLDEAALGEMYRDGPGAMRVHSETDLNARSIDRILDALIGTSVVDVGCGQGYLASRLGAVGGLSVVGVDVHDGLATSTTFVAGALPSLPFADGAFDTVVCTHTLEHVLDFEGSVAELRRVTGRRLIIVVPAEREYRWGFNLHVNFFPYRHSLLNRLRPLAERHGCDDVDGDLLYWEDRELAN